MRSVTPDEYLLQLRSATADLISAIGGLSDADVRAPSPLPGWTRGHVLTHLARNADGGIRLLAWLIGRSDGGELSREGIVRLPEVPQLYAT